MVKQVSIERGYPSQRETLANLVQLYIHDFNDFLPRERRIAMDDTGLYPDALRLDEYWSEPDRSVWFIRADAALAGFALLNRHSHSGLALDTNMGEFFIARAYRDKGVGSRAGAALFRMHPGQWEVAIGAGNHMAWSFWPLAIAQADPQDLQKLDGDDNRWTGRIIRFVVRPPAPISQP